MGRKKRTYREFAGLSGSDTFTVLSEKLTYVSPRKVSVKKPEGRYLVEVSDTSAKIVGVSIRTNQKRMSRFKTLMNELYNLNLKGY